MKALSIGLLLTTASCHRTVTDVSEHAAGVDPGEADVILFPQANRGGWVNPEDIVSMPQCIAQQDTTLWLRSMSECTSKRCTNHFGVICTHHQWLTQLSCLTTAFSPDVLQGYLPYCSRSVLAKAQLYEWIRKSTGRTWLVDVGDTNELQNLTPASLVGGYATLGVADKAPSCLTRSTSAVSGEHFQHSLASCRFTGTAQHTGNSKRPWEYSESHHSMLALDFETASYGLTGRSIGDGDSANYFDKACFCDIFTLDWTSEPCLHEDPLDMAKERMWMNATCGVKSLPQKWTHGLRTTAEAYIPIDDWHWPTCVVDLPHPILELTDRCATDACNVDSDGYCSVTRAVDRSCFCHNIDYETCRGSCHVFENRIEYVNWLYDLCAGVPNWNGLPDDWRRLAAPMAVDLIPWGWIPAPNNNSSGECFSNDAKVGVIALVNAATVLAAFFSRQLEDNWILGHCLNRYPFTNWLSAGTFIVGLQLIAYWLTALVVQETPGYEDIPSIQLMLFWCTMPRLTWIKSFIIDIWAFGAKGSSAAASSLFAEMTLQFLSAYYMIWTIAYGRAHGLYFGGLAGAESERSAQEMYYGALLWLVIIIVAPIPLIRAVRINRSNADGVPELPKYFKTGERSSSLPEEFMAQVNEICHWSGERLIHSWMDERTRVETAPLTASHDNDRHFKNYGTLPTPTRSYTASDVAFLKLYAVTGTTMVLLWIAQWIFWIGFIGLTGENFCPYNMRVIAAVWIIASLGIMSMRTTTSR